MGSDIGIDLGTASVLVYLTGKGVVLREPSVVAFDRDTGKIKEIGEEARLMLGRTPGNIVAIRPLRQGVISDYTITEKMLVYFIQKAVGKKHLRKPKISICVPSGATEVEKNAVEQAAYQAGARDVMIIEEPIAAAIGAGIDISRPCGNMIVDIGGGTTDIAVISLGGTVVSSSIKIAGDDFDEAIVRYMRKQHNLLIGERTAEDIKINIGSAFKRQTQETLDVRGRNLVTGLPKTITVTSDETEEALKDGADEIDMVINIGLAKSGDFKGVQREISQIKDVCRDKILKVIVEACLLTEREKIELCRAVSQSGADFIKTSTGFAGGGATDEDIILFKKYVDPHVKIKAAGGISTLEDAHRFLQLGASRLGTSKIIRLICKRSENHELSDTSY